MHFGSIRHIAEVQTLRVHVTRRRRRPCPLLAVVKCTLEWRMMPANDRGSGHTINHQTTSERCLPPFDGGCKNYLVLQEQPEQADEQESEIQILSQ